MLCSSNHVSSVHWSIKGCCDWRMPRSSDEVSSGCRKSARRQHLHGSRSLERGSVLALCSGAQTQGWMSRGEVTAARDCRCRSTSSVASSLVCSCCCSRHCSPRVPQPAFFYCLIDSCSSTRGTHWCWGWWGCWSVSGNRRRPHT